MDLSVSIFFEDCKFNIVFITRYGFLVEFRSENVKNRVFRSYSNEPREKQLQIISLSGYSIFETTPKLYHPTNLNFI